MSRYVVSLGGNALGNNPEEQKQLLKNVAEPIVELINKNHEVIIVHGNGPQVGMINLAFNESKSTPEMPFPECGAMSQGYIGFHLQNAIKNELLKRGIEKEIGALVTQVIVDENDAAFNNPSKPIGSFYDKHTADQLTKEKHYVMQEDSGRGYRRVVASPKPIDVVEKNMIKTLLKDKHVVICSGGGGIPVIEKNNQLEGVAAVIDKDYASAKVAELIDADYLIILTAVEFVFINYNTPQELALKNTTIQELVKYINQGHFAKGSMYPKVQACIDFVGDTNKKAVISSLDKAVEAFNFKTGTIIEFN